MVFGKFGFFYVCRFCLVLNLFGSESWLDLSVKHQSGQLPARIVNTGRQYALINFRQWPLQRFLLWRCWPLAEYDG